MRAMLRTDKHDPTCTKSTIDIEEPIRDNPLMDKAAPKFATSKTDSVEPQYDLPNTDKREPKRE
jgi:hypothetical protein